MPANKWHLDQNGGASKHTLTDSIDQMDQSAPASSLSITMKPRNTGTGALLPGFPVPSAAAPSISTYQNTEDDSFSW